MKPEDIIKQHYQELAQKSHEAIRKNNPDHWKRAGALGGKAKKGYRKPRKEDNV